MSKTNLPKANYSIASALAEFDISIDHLTTNNMVNDSRAVQKGDVFCAIIGTVQDGREYIDQALNNGAGLIIVQCQLAQQHGNIMYKSSAKLGGKTPVVQFYQLDKKLFLLAQSYYQSPQENMLTVGITGTNGKTSTAITLASLLTNCHKKSAVIGTVGAGVFPKISQITNTTPGSTETFNLISNFAKQDVKYLTMEVSSHAIHQKRVLPELFDVAVFTNLSRDHLDYHETMKAYADVKFSLFNSQKAQLAVINADDAYANDWLKQTIVKTENLFLYGRNSEIKALPNAGYAIAENIQHHQQGISFELRTHLGNCDIQSPQLGDFNIDNLLAAISVLLTQRFSLEDIKQAIIALSAVIGRMETFNGKDKPLAIVDYAHTPDGLEKALMAAKQHCTGELWVVFGCGGDRDKGKRPEMGAIAESYADHIIVTNDNPRTEAPEMIVSEILSGCKKMERITIILDRVQAIKSAFSHAKPEDCILFAGKGHEDYIVIGTEKVPYNERELVQAYYKKAIL